MNEDPNATNNPSGEEVSSEPKFTMEDSTSFGDGTDGELFGIGDSQGAGAEDQNSEGTTETKSDAAPKADGTAPEGTTGKDAGTEQPISFKGQVNPAVQKFLKDKGFWNDEGNSIEVDKLHKSYTEMESFSTEARSSLANFKNQVSALQSVKDGAEPLTVEAVNQSHGDTVSNLQTVSDFMNALANGTATPEQKLHFNDWLKEEYDAAQNEKFARLQEIRDAEFARKHGLVPKGATEMESPEIARQKATDNVLSNLASNEQSTEAINQIIGNDYILNIVNSLAASMFPREYNAGNTDQEIAKNNQNAVNRVLAGNPDIAKAIVELGRNNLVAQQSVKKLEDHGRAEYQRGLADGRKGVNAQTPASTPNAVNNASAASSMEGRTKQFASLSDSNEWGN